MSVTSTALKNDSEIEAAPTSPTDLVLRAQAGDRRAEGLLCARLAPAVRTFWRRRLRNEDAVREMQQEVLLLLVEALRRGTIDDPSRVGGFVLGICKNLALDRARQRERRAALWEKYGAEIAPLDVQPIERPNEFILRLEDCLTNISQRARDIVRLAYGESKSHAEIAERLKISETNARVLRHRTLRALRECMSSEPASWGAA